MKVSGSGSVPPIKPNTTQPTQDTSPSTEFYFGSDIHDNIPLLDTFISQANQNKPDLVISGGDLENNHVTDSKIGDELSKSNVPMAFVPGNHDIKGAEVAGTEKKLGEANQSFDVNGVHFVMLDDSTGSISEETFNFLEKDLAENQGKPIAVAMHVPAEWEAKGFSKELHELVPKGFASPTISDENQVKRFTDLMSKYNVGLVLSGHTHEPADLTVGGVRYVTAGSVGGKLLTAGLSHEYLDVKVQDGKFSVSHMQLDKPISLGKAIAADGKYLYQQRNSIENFVEKQVDKVEEKVDNVADKVDAKVDSVLDKLKKLVKWPF